MPNQASYVTSATLEYIHSRQTRISNLEITLQDNTLLLIYTKHMQCIHLWNKCCQVFLDSLMPCAALRNLICPQYSFQVVSKLFFFQDYKFLSAQNLPKLFFSFNIQPHNLWHLSVAVIIWIWRMKLFGSANLMTSSTSLCGKLFIYHTFPSHRSFAILVLSFLPLFIPQINMRKAFCLAVRCWKLLVFILLTWDVHIKDKMILWFLFGCWFLPKLTKSLGGGGKHIWMSFKIFTQNLIFLKENCSLKPAIKDKNRAKVYHAPYNISRCFEF